MLNEKTDPNSKPLLRTRVHPPPTLQAVSEKGGEPHLPKEKEDGFSVRLN